MNLSIKNNRNVSELVVPDLLMVSNTIKEG